MLLVFSKRFFVTHSSKVDVSNRITGAPCKIPGYDFEKGFGSFPPCPSSLILVVDYLAWGSFGFHNVLSSVALDGIFFWYNTSYLFSRSVSTMVFRGFFHMLPVSPLVSVAYTWFNICVPKEPMGLLDFHSSPFEGIFL